MAQLAGAARADRAPRAIALARDRVRVEPGGAPESVLAGAQRVAVLAHFSSGRAVTRSFRALVAELVGADYRVVVVSSATCAGDLDWGPADLAGVVVLRKPNVGYDFGSWAVALDRYPAMGSAGFVLLANDSLVGPFAPIAPLLARFEATPADVWGLTETLQFTRHLQSYFVGYRRGVLAEPPLARFWSGVRHYEDKQLVIHRNEIGLGQLLEREGYTVDAAYVAGQVVDPADNPTIAGWRQLIDDGFPFIKRELVRSPELAVDGADIPAAVEKNFRTDVNQWLL